MWEVVSRSYQPTFGKRVIPVVCGMATGIASQPNTSSDDELCSCLEASWLDETLSLLCICKENVYKLFIPSASKIGLVGHLCLNYRGL